MNLLRGGTHAFQDFGNRTGHRPDRGSLGIGLRDLVQGAPLAGLAGLAFKREFDLTLNAVEDGETLGGSLEYDAGLFEGWR